MKPVPHIFWLMDEYTNRLENTDAGWTADGLQITQHILEHPYDLYLIFAGMSVFAYAACISLECLQAVHAGYLHIQAKENGQPDHPVPPYDLKGFGGYTALHSTLEFNLTQEATYLINDVKVNVNIADDKNNTPLHLACLVKNTHVIRNLVISGGASVNVTNSQFQTPLHMCVLSNDIENCKFLLSKGAKTSFRKGRFLIDVRLDVNKIGSTEMKLFFSKYKNQQRYKNSASKQLNQKRRAIKNQYKEYEFVCSQIEDETNKQLVESLASQLLLKNTINKSKRELCDMIVTKLGFLSITATLS